MGKILFVEQEICQSLSFQEAESIWKFAKKFQSNEGILQEMFPF